MTTMPDLSSYVSPLSWRYGTPEMKQLFGEEHKYRLWRSVWVALARAQHQAGLVTREELDDLVAHEKDVDSKTIVEIEEETHHDVVAAIREYALKAKIGGKKIHLGATSMDVVDNADAIRVGQAMRLTRKNIITLLGLLADKITQYADEPCMGYTHLQPAEPTTVGYRFATYAYDVLTDLRLLEFVLTLYKGKGMKGAVGTRASYVSLLKDSNMTAQKLDETVMQELGIEAALITTQVYPRKFDYLILSVLASVSSSVSKFASDVRLLQSPSIGEWAEPFGKKQVGSSAMPFKRNPVNSEKICSLARYVTKLPSVALENAMLCHLERTLDDSANRRLILSEGFIALDEILRMGLSVVDGMIISRERISYNLAQYAPFSATEVLLIELVKKGANRQDMHEVLRSISMAAWGAIQKGEANPMQTLLENDPAIKKYLTTSEIRGSFDVTHHVGDAPARARKLVSQIKKEVKQYE